MTQAADMTGAATRTQSISYKTGWWILVVIAGVSIVGYLVSLVLPPRRWRWRLSSPWRA